jgi:flagellar hook-length control protein FliK
VPQVASEATTHALRPSLPNPARAARNPNRGHSSPFESLLDNGPQAPTEPPPRSPPAPNDKPARAAKPDSTQASAKTAVSKTAQPGDNADSDNANYAAVIDATVKVQKAVSLDTASADAKIDDKTDVKTDAKTLEQALAVDNSKSAGDGKPTGGPALVILAADAASNPTQAMTPAAAVANAPGAFTAAAPVGIPQAAPAAAAQAALTAGQTAIIAAEAPKFNAVDLAAPHADAGKPAENLKSSAKPAFELPSDREPQPAAGDAGKTATAQPHDETPANAHHAAAAETPPTVPADAQAIVPKAAADAVQQAQLTPPSHDVSPAPANPATPAPPAAQAEQAEAVPLAGVAVEIAGKALAGKNRFEIRLDPPELGRIDVRLDVGRDGQVTSHLTADRPETLDLLRRDSAGLERALQDAGLKTGDNGLQFSLRDQTMGREQSHTPTPGAALIVVHDDALAINDATQRNYSRLAGLRGGIDIRV